MTNPLHFTLASLHASVAAGSYSYEQLMLDTLAAIEHNNPTINAIVALQDESALFAQAKEADRLPVTGTLHGIPMALKDLVNVKGIVSTFGSPLLRNNIPDKDDVIAVRLRNAGAIIIGKTNTPEFGLGSQTYNTVYGATANPYNTNKTCGGSSGGAAAALASGMLIVADGSDMMGSLRNPAAYCNVYGFRPSYGLVPNEPKGDTFMHQLATLGPMAKTIEDLASLLDVIAAPDNKHPHSIHQVPHFATAITSPPSKLKHIGWLADWDGAFPMEPGVIDVCEQALKVFQNAGHTVEPVPAPYDNELLWHSWSTLRSFAIASLLGDSYRSEKTRSQLKPEAIYEIELGLSLSGTDIAKASLIRSDWFSKAACLFEHYDALVLPSCQVFPFAKSEYWPTQINQKPMTSYHKWMEVVVPASLIGIPALNLPAGFSDSGLPMGMQLIGARNNDAALLQLGNEYHQATLWPQSVPSPFTAGN